PSFDCAKPTYWRIGAPANRQSLCDAGRHSKSTCCLSGFPHTLEKCRPRHSRAETSQSRVREAAIAEFDCGESLRIHRGLMLACWASSCDHLRLCPPFPAKKGHR